MFDDFFPPPTPSPHSGVLTVGARGPDLIRVLHLWRGILAVNACINVLFWDVHVHFDRAVSHKIGAAVLWSSWWSPPKRFWWYLSYHVLAWRSCRGHVLEVLGEDLLRVKRCLQRMIFWRSLWEDLLRILLKPLPGDPCIEILGVFLWDVYFLLRSASKILYIEGLRLTIFGFFGWCPFIRCRSEFLMNGKEVVPFLVPKQVPSVVAINEVEPLLFHSCCLHLVHWLPPTVFQASCRWFIFLGWYCGTNMFLRSE